jgi:hypothetical protein
MPFLLALAYNRHDKRSRIEIRFWLGSVLDHTSDEIGGSYL